MTTGDMVESLNGNSKMRISIGKCSSVNTMHFFFFFLIQVFLTFSHDAQLTKAY